MKASELVKIKPGTIIWATILKTEVENTENENLVTEQEICVEVKSVRFEPSRKDLELMQIKFNPIELQSDDWYPFIDYIFVRNQEKITATSMAQYKGRRDKKCEQLIRFSSIELE